MTHAAACCLHRRQASGASLLVALVVLVMMSMGALAMVRAVTTGMLVAGNFAFRQAAVLASERGSEAAINWLSAHAGTAGVLSDQPADGYYAQLLPGLDLTGSDDNATAAVDWAADSCSGRTGLVCLRPSAALPVDAAGHSIRFLIQRICRRDGSPDAASNSCQRHRSALNGSPNHGQISYGVSKHFQPTNAVYYRITVHVRGPRGTTVFTQTLVHF